ncbi:MAG: RecB family exonuclease [Myxococcaceae bacterium]
MQSRVLTNDFSWSKSRHEKLRECARAYYLHYYASWQGWERNAPPATRELYILKKLGNRFTWVGSVVHDAIRDVLTDVRFGRVIDEAALTERVYQRMRTDFRSSMRKAYWTEKSRRGFTGLVEHEYAEPIPDSDWKAGWETVRAAIQWFLSSRWLPLARALKPAQWLEVDESFETANFNLDGVRVFAIPDFAYVDEDGSPVVVDWKTGQAREGYDEQVLGYALYIAQRYGFPVERVKTALVYLNDGKEIEVRVDASAEARFRQHFQDSVASMRALLENPQGNQPKASAEFAMTQDLNKCAHCVFRRPCGRAAQVEPARLESVAA